MSRFLFLFFHSHVGLNVRLFLEQDGHRFPIPVPDVDERFRAVPEDDPFEMSGLELSKQV